MTAPLSSAARDELVVIRADASVTMGGGHVMRCLVLADALVGMGWKVVLANNLEASDVVRGLSDLPTGLSLLEVSSARNPHELMKKLGSGCALVVVDHHELDAAYEEPLAAWSDRILVIDDLADRPHCADLLLDQTPGRTAVAYKGLVSPTCTLLLGAGYGLLRPGFAERRAGALARGRSSLERLFIGFGATDAGGMTPVAVRAVAAAGLDVELDVVLGVASTSIGAAKQAIEESGLRARLHIQASDVDRLMADADLAIGACGSSSLERCAVGLPCLGVVTAANQTVMAGYLEAAGAIRVVGHRHAFDPSRLTGALRELAASPETLAAMASAAATVCDGMGAARTAAAVGAPTWTDLCASS